MGTTESTLNDPSAEVQDPAQNATPVKVTLTTPSKTATATALATASASATATAPRIPRSEPLPHSHSHSPRNPTTTTSIGSITPSQHHSTTNPIASNSNSNLSPRAPKLKVLKGAVCGHEHVGKSSLMYRLRGEENKNILAKSKRSKNPNRTNQKKRRMMALIPWTMESSLSASADSTCTLASTTSTSSAKAKAKQRDGYGRGHEGVIETVQLHIVELHEEHYSDLVKRSPIDFLILVIDRTNRDSLDYVLAYLDSIVDATANAANGESESEKSVDDLPSICILLNHYDAIIEKNTNTNNQGDQNNSEKDDNEDGNATDSSQTKILSLQVVQSMIENKCKSLARIRIRIQYIDACMNNGYGIEALNSFISLPYLKVKERELIKQLEAVRQGLTNWEKGFEEKKFVSFEELEDFCKQEQDQDKPLEDRQQQEQDKETSVAIHKGRDEAETAISTATAAESNENEIQNRKYGEDNGGDNTANKQSRMEQHSQKSIPDTRRRNIMPTVENEDSAEGAKSSSKKISSKKKKRERQSKSNTEKVKEEKSKANVRSKRPVPRTEERSRNFYQRRKQPVYNDPKQALEAFLASDDDSEDSSAGANDVSTTYDSPEYVNHGNFRNMAVLDSDSDESSIDTSGHRAFVQIRVKPVDSSRNSGNPKIDNASEGSGGSQKSSKGEVIRRSISASESEESDACEELDAVQAPDCDQDLEDHADSQSREKLSNTFGNSPPSDKSAEEGEGEEDKEHNCNSESDSVITEQEMKPDIDKILPDNADRSGEEDKETLSNSDAGSSTTEQGLEHEGRDDASKDQAKQVDVVSRDVPKELDIDKEGHITNDHIRSQKEQEGSNDNEDSEELTIDQDEINDSNSADEQPVLFNEILSHDENCERNLSALKPIEKVVENGDESNDVSNDNECRTTSDCSVGDNSNDSNIKRRTTSDCSIKDSNRVHIDVHQTEVAKLPDLNDRERQEQYSPSDAYESLEDSDEVEARLRTKKDERQHIIPYPSTNSGPVNLESDSDDDFIVEDTQDERITMTKARKNVINRNKVNYPGEQNRTSTRERELDPHVSDAIQAALLLAQKEAENTLRDVIATERNPKPKKSKKGKKSDSSMKQKKKKKKSSTISYM